jgi:hypothetical protein
MIILKLILKIYGEIGWSGFNWLSI